MRTRRRCSVRPFLDQLEERRLLWGFTPAQLTTAYGLSAITFSTSSGTIKGDGAGETIALVEAYHDPTLASDLHVFDRTYDLPDPSLAVVNLAGTVTNQGWTLEEALDVEWAHAVAPGANILVVEAKSQSRQNLLAAVEVARNTPGVVAVSMSWGFSEIPAESSSHFTTPPGHVGITFVAASGDSGPRGGAEWPAVSPTVLSVGGTTLTVDSSGNYQSETPWAGGSGGYSRYELEPGYQRGVQSTGRKSTPDVALDGDPNTGVAVYETSPTGQGQWPTVGGTSLGTPVWAAIIAIADQGRALEGKGSLDGPSQALPSLYALPSSDFHIVPDPGHKRARADATANTETGLGSPNGPSLIADLVASNAATPLTLSGRTLSRAAHRTGARPAKLVIAGHARLEYRDPRRAR
jgi:subtilase family serine protease